MGSRLFLVSRITRIYPLWWVCAGIMAIYFYVTYGMPAAPDRIAGTDEAVVYAAKSLLLFPQQAPPLLGLGWTLIHEMFFYVIFAFILFLPRQYLLTALAVWGTATLAGSFAIRPADYGRNILELATSPLSLEFIAGAVAGWLVSQCRFVMPNLFIGAGVIGVLLGFALFPNNGETNYTVVRVAIFTLPFLCLVYGCVGAEIRSGVVFPDWLVKLGDWSYSLYLTHFIVLVALRRLYRIYAPDSLEVGAEGVMDNLVFAVLTLTISIISAAIFYTCIERPAINFFRARRQKTVAS